MDRLTTALAGIIAIAVYIAVDHRGVELTPDGYAYWQGAISIAAGNGYTYFSGHPIVSWPPLFSLYLAAWVLVFGASGLTLLGANAVLIGAQGCLWYRLSAELAVHRRIAAEPNPLTSILVALYIGIFVSINQSQLLAQNLVYVFLPLQIVFCWRAIGSDGPDALRMGATSAVFSALCLLAHNGSLAFCGAASLLFMLFGRLGWSSRSAVAFAMLGFPLVIWALIRFWLGEQHSHLVGLGAGRFSLVENLEMMTRGLIDLILPRSIHLLAGLAVVLLAAVLVVRLAKPSFALAFGTLYVAASLAGLLVVFSVTWIHDPLYGRFLWFAPLVLVPLTMEEVAAARRSVLLALIWLATLPLAAARAVDRVVFMAHPSAVQDGKPALGRFPLHAELSRVPGANATRVVDGVLLVGPIEWEERSWGLVGPNLTAPQIGIPPAR